MDKKTTVYYAKDDDEAARILAVLQANGIEAEEKSLGEQVYHDITVETALTEEKSRWRKRRKSRPEPLSGPGRRENRL